MKLFYILNLRSLKGHWKLVLLNIISFFVSITMLSTIFMLNESKMSFASRDGYNLNRGDMSVYLITMDDVRYTREEMQMADHFNIWFHDYLKGKEDVNFTYEHIGLANSLQSQSYIHPNEIVTPPLFAFIDFNYIDRIVSGANPLLVSKDTIFLSEFAANRIGAKVGDTLNFSRDVNQPTLSYQIEGTCKDIGLNYDAYGTMLGVAYFDVSQIPAILSVEPYNITGDFYPEMITLFYVDGPQDTLKQIEIDARHYAKELGFRYPLHVAYSDDMTEAVNIATSTYNIVLSFFTIICIITSTFTIFQLLQLRIFNRQKEIALLKILGMKNYQNIIHTILELLMCVLPAMIFGIIAALYIIVPIGKEIPLYNLDYFGVKEFVGSSFKVVISIISLICAISIPTLYFVNSRNIQDVLRQQSELFMMKRKQIIILMLINGVYLTILFASFVGILLAVALITIIVGIFCITALICKMFLLLLGLVDTKSYALIGIRYIKRNNSRVFFSVVTTTICLTLFLSAMTIGFTTTSQAEAIMKEDFGYNFHVTVSTEQDADFIKFLDEQNIKYAYSQTTGIMVNVKDQIQETDFQEKAFPLLVYDKAPSPEFLKNLDNGAILGHRVSALYRKRPGSIITLQLEDNTSETFEVPVSAKGAIRFQASNTEIAILAEDLPNKSMLEGLTKTYYFDISKSDQDVIQDYVYGKRNIIALNGAEEATQNMMLLSKFYYLFKVFISFFIVSIFTLVLSCTLINYGNRLQEFCVYQAYGATKSMLRKIIILEGSLQAVVSSFIAIVLAFPIVSFFGLFVAGFFAKVSLPFALLTSVIACVLQIFVAVMTLTMIKFKSVSTVLRTGDTGE